MSAMLEIKNLSKTFNKGTINEKIALDHINLTLNEGDFVTVIGGNGAGKSTMLNAVAGVWPADEGAIIVDGNNITNVKAGEDDCSQSLFKSYLLIHVIFEILRHFVLLKKDWFRVQWQYCWGPWVDQAFVRPPHVQSVSEFLDYRVLHVAQI